MFFAGLFPGLGPLAVEQSQCPLNTKGASQKRKTHDS
jgi:hypothetical protein